VTGLEEVTVLRQPGGAEGGEGGLDAGVLLGTSAATDRAGDHQRAQAARGQSVVGRAGLTNGGRGTAGAGAGGASPNSSTCAVSAATGAVSAASCAWCVSTSAISAARSNCSNAAQSTIIARAYRMSSSLPSHSELLLLRSQPSPSGCSSSIKGLCFR
jgi:hypothetical protein